jgi:hypothetical protein
LGEFFAFLGDSVFDSVDFGKFFTPGTVFFFGPNKKLWMTSPATLLRDLATRIFTNSSLRIFDQPGTAISLASDPKSASVNELSSFEVAIVYVSFDSRKVSRYHRF